MVTNARSQLTRVGQAQISRRVKFDVNASFYQRRILGDGRARHRKGLAYPLKVVPGVGRGIPKRTTQPS